ncbi:Uncharacterised protein [Streptococcus pneumoniae]|nr:Uncharacterised protein [Streptococcus pneumoniae]VJD87421.1 Uncharacterised protein [Streptococcus pneumoniae]VJG99397.1 Uncharacterised protein [Streptococcus pneumoniae]VJL63731.1 Uncharacterised protein [Streptococcus pneumoniae]VKF14607.1 Uncharacterised protein [Streptococcus pneumoniae]
MVFRLGVNNWGSILYKIYSLRREKSKYLTYTAYIIFGVNVVYGIQWLLRELISTISP